MVNQADRWSPAVGAENRDSMAQRPYAMGAAHAV
jgi:hypothetical protein